MSFRLLIINPGSTSTKAALFEDDQKLSDIQISHKIEELAEFNNVADQFQFRLKAIDPWIDSLDIDKNPLSVVVGRGAPLCPLEGGAYAINPKMLNDLKSARFSNHASNLGAIIADYFANRYDVPSLISDPITVDNFSDIARVSGVPEIVRKCRVHALNIKEVCRRQAAKQAKQLEDLSFVAIHIGGGISVASVKKGKIIDVNDGLLGMGPFSPDRAGALPIGGLVELCYSKKFSKEEMIAKLSKKSGLLAYTGTADLRDAEKIIDGGNKKTLLYFNAMAYQIAKEIGTASVVLQGDFESIVLTGGMAHSERLVNEIKKYISFLGKIVVMPGEFEMEALASAGLRFLHGEEKLKEYNSDR